MDTGKKRKTLKARKRPKLRTVTLDVPADMTDLDIRVAIANHRVTKNFGKKRSHLPKGLREDLQKLGRDVAHKD